MSRIAVATSNGGFVDRHFGQAGRFDVYDADLGEYALVETRLVSPACSGGSHSEGGLEQAAALISDCDFLVASRVGLGAARLLSDKGLRSFESPFFPVQDVIRKFSLGWPDIRAEARASAQSTAQSATTAHGKSASIEDEEHGVIAKEAVK
jgi:predicted Fe-Mo cluster-binding NifX family protein